MSKTIKYFSGKGGVYYDPAEKFQDLILITEVEPYELIHKKTFKITKIKRFNIETANYTKMKVALTPCDSLVYLGVL